MALSSAVRFRPFSHQPRTLCLVPGSSLACEIFASKLLFFDYRQHSKPQVFALTWSQLGPFEKFCVIQDLEQGHILVQGHTNCGFVRYKIFAQKGGKSWGIEYQKLPKTIECELSIFTDGEQLVNERVVVREKDTVQFLENAEDKGHAKLQQRERLTLGVDKSQEWSQVVRRGELREIVPYWYWLAQSIIYPENKSLGEGSSLLCELRQVIAQKQKEKVLNKLAALFQAGFTEQFVPQLQDCYYRGFTLPVISHVEASPLALLSETFPLIRSLFFVEEAERFHCLPLLPSDFHCGTLSPIITAKGHKVSLEWTKGIIRRVLIEAACDDSIIISFQKPIEQFRLAKHLFANHAVLHFRERHTYLLDNFQK